MRLSTCLLLCTMAAPAVAQGGGSSAPVVINEFSYMDENTDDLQFVELYNRTREDVDISGWRVMGEEGSSGGLPNGFEVIPPNTVLDPGGYYVIGQPRVPNIDQLLVVLTLFEDGPDGLTLRDLNNNVVDAVTWKMNDWTAPVPSWLEGSGMRSDTYNPDSNRQSAARKWNGCDDDDNGFDFRVTPWSPGASNQAVLTTSLPYVNDFDAPGGTTLEADFNHSFSPGGVVDPADLLITPSPQGGNCAIWYDRNGATANFLKIAATRDLEFECYVHLQGPSALFDADDGEAWSIGVRGGQDSFAHPYDVGGFHSVVGCASFYDPGATGIAWSYFRTRSAADLYLLDYGHGGGYTVLHGPIAITSANDGWQRLRVSVQGGSLTANFGGTYGQNNGTVVTAANVTVSHGTFYTHYSSCVRPSSVPFGEFPLTVDALRIGCCPGTRNFGAGSPDSRGQIPVIGLSGQAQVGGTFTITGSNMQAFQLVILGIGFEPMFEPGVQIPDAQPGASLHFGSPTILFVLADGSGNVSAHFGLPPFPWLECLGFGAQIFPFDGLLPYSVPIASSDALFVRIAR